LRMEYEYPYSWKFIIFSIFLISASILFAIYSLNDMFLLLMYFLSVLAFSIFFFFVKLRIYSRATAKTETQEPISKRTIVILLFILIIGVSLPFLLLLFSNPVAWFLIITSFIAGINIPEILLYVIYHIYSKRDDNSI